MSPPVIRYAITDRHLLAADERDRTSLTPAPSQQKTPAAARRPAHPAPGETPSPLDRSETQRRDLPSPATTLSQQLARLEHQAQRLRAHSVDYLQLREKDLAPADLRTVATVLRQALPPGSHPRLLLNLGRPQDQPANLATALALAADGFHLPANTPAGFPAEIRTAFARACRSTPILSCSAHTLAEVVAARVANFDLILFGPVFGKTVVDPSGQGQLVADAVGLQALAAAVKAAGPIPILALGGITNANAASCLAAGARGLAGIRLFLST